MRIYVVSFKRYAWLLVALAFISGLVFLNSIIYSDVIGAFQTESTLPIYSVDSDEKRVAISFDCAWGADDIPDILDTLRREDIKATFFIVGQWAEKFPDSVKAISEGGHDVANHSYSHPRMGVLENKKIKEEISLCDNVLSSITGSKNDLFRAPYGDYSSNLVSTAKDLGYYTIQWDVDSLDWKPGISESEIFSRVTTKVKNGSIILFHNDTPHTSKILPQVITALKNEGYQFCPVSKLILREKYIIDFAGRQKRNE